MSDRIPHLLLINYKLLYPRYQEAWPSLDRSSLDLLLIIRPFAQLALLPFRAYRQEQQLHLRTATHLSQMYL